LNCVLRLSDGFCLFGVSHTKGCFLHTSNDKPRCVEHQENKLVGDCFAIFQAFDLGSPYIKSMLMLSKPICWQSFTALTASCDACLLPRNFSSLSLKLWMPMLMRLKGSRRSMPIYAGRKIVGVGFQRNLNEVVHRKFGIQGVKNLFNMFLLQARRRSSTEINRPNGFVCKHLFSQAYFPAYRFGKFVDMGFVCLRIKIAVDAPRFAERNMKINPCQYYFFSLMISRTKSGSSVVM